MTEVTFWLAKIEWSDENPDRGKGNLSAMQTLLLG
jgi:hypothetical protein